MNKLEKEIAFLSEPDFTEILSVWESSVTASHHFLSEADIRFYKPLVYTEYLPMLSLFGIRNASGGLEGFIGILDDKMEMLFVHPDFFGKGVGSALCSFAIRELNVSKVDVNEDNEEAFKFYSKVGFRVVGRSPLDPNGNPFPILHMEMNDFVNISS